jgi:WD40 repeat protein
MEHSTTPFKETTGTQTLNFTSISRASILETDNS